MADLVIKNVDKETVDRLKKRAKENNRSVEEELKELIERYYGRKQYQSVKVVQQIQDGYRNSGTLFPDSSQDISEERQR